MKSFLLAIILFTVSGSLLAQKIKELKPKTTVTGTSNVTGKTNLSPGKTSVIVKNKDSDGDGIIDEQDPCPFKRGPLTNNGCPLAAVTGESGSDLYKKGLEAYNNSSYTEAVELLERATALKNGSAACLLGKIYFEGDALPPNMEKAFAYFDTAASYGNDMAMYNLGIMYKNGYGVSLDYNKAMENLYKAADKGNDESMLELGDIFFAGEMVPKNNSKAIEWYEKAANQENAAAYNNLGNIYFKGEVVAKNIEKASAWFKKGADKSDVYSMRMLGICQEQKKYLGEAYGWFRKAAEKEDLYAITKLVTAYRTGAGNINQDPTQYQEWYNKALESAERQTEDLDAETLLEIGKMLTAHSSPDRKKAFTYFKKAADAGNVQAFMLTGSMAMEGFGDGYNDAVYYYTKAAEVTDNPEAMNHLGNIYLGQLVPAKKDLKLAARWLTAAADKGNAEAANSLGKLYLIGSGVEINFKKSFDLFTASASKKYFPGVWMLGLCYYQGWGTSKDLNKALENYLIAANADLPVACLSAGRMYYAGEGTEKNFQKAFDFFQKASQLGLAEAMTAIGEMYESGNGFSKSMTKAVEWYRKAAELDDASGMYKMALLLTEGNGVEKDPITANKWMTKAASKGNYRAKHYLGMKLLKEKDYAGAFKNFKEAANNNVRESAFYLASFYEEGIATLQNYTEAMKWYEIAANYNNSDAMNNLGLMYQNGKGVSSPDFSTAAKWYTRGAELGNPSAMNNLGSLYNTGKGVQQSKRTALDWFKKACDAGSQTGCDNVKKFR